MPLNYPKPGLGHVAEFQRSCTPYVDSVVDATKTITLTYVTSEVVVAASGGAGTVHFGDIASKAFTIPSGAALIFKVRSKKIVIVSSGVGITVSVCALLTGISSNELPQHNQNDWGSTA